MVPPDDHERLPEWWEQNEALRDEMDLPPYRPPRFSDGVYTHEVIPELEDDYDCVILFAGFNTQYPDDWRVEVDGTPLMEIGRHRDENGNTVYEMTSTQFEKEFEDCWEDEYGESDGR